MMDRLQVKAGLHNIQGKPAIVQQKGFPYSFLIRAPAYHQQSLYKVGHLFINTNKMSPICTTEKHNFFIKPNFS